MKFSSFDLRKKILVKMVVHRWWGGKHIAFDNISKGFPNEVRKDVKKELEKLCRGGFIIKKPTGYGLHVSLNVRMKREIDEIVTS
ncbi:MAG: hypothetical protein ABH821_02660 [archaeon]